MYNNCDNDHCKYESCVCVCANGKSRRSGIRVESLKLPKRDKSNPWK